MTASFDYFNRPLAFTGARRPNRAVAGWLVRGRARCPTTLGPRHELSQASRRSSAGCLSIRLVPPSPATGGTQQVAAGGEERKTVSASEGRRVASRQNSEPPCCGALR